MHIHIKQNIVLVPPMAFASFEFLPGAIGKVRLLGCCVFVYRCGGSLAKGFIINEPSIEFNRLMVGCI